MKHPNGIDFEIESIALQDSDNELQYIKALLLTLEIFKEVTELDKSTLTRFFFRFNPTLPYIKTYRFSSEAIEVLEVGVNPLSSIQASIAQWQSVRLQIQFFGVSNSTSTFFAAFIPKDGIMLVSFIWQRSRFRRLGLIPLSSIQASTAQWQSVRLQIQFFDSNLSFFLSFLSLPLLYSIH
jgi:hypothetical protein